MFKRITEGLITLYLKAMTGVSEEKWHRLCNTQADSLICNALDYCNALLNGSKTDWENKPGSENQTMKDLIYIWNLKSTTLKAPELKLQTVGSQPPWALGSSCGPSERECLLNHWATSKVTGSQNKLRGWLGDDKWNISKYMISHAEEGKSKIAICNRFYIFSP